MTIAIVSVLLFHVVALACTVAVTVKYRNGQLDVSQRRLMVYGVGLLWVASIDAMMFVIPVTRTFGPVGFFLGFLEPAVFCFVVGMSQPRSRPEQSVDGSASQP